MSTSDSQNQFDYQKLSFSGNPKMSVNGLLNVELESDTPASWQLSVLQTLLSVHFYKTSIPLP